MIIQLKAQQQQHTRFSLKPAAIYDLERFISFVSSLTTIYSSFLVNIYIQTQNMCSFFQRQKVKQNFKARMRSQQITS